MNRRQFVSAAGATSLAAIAGCSFGDDGLDRTGDAADGDGTGDPTDEGGTDESGDGESKTTELASIRAVEDRFDPGRVERPSGARDERSDPFPLEDGLTVVTYEHGAGFDFAIELLDGDGDRVETIVEHDGTIDGAAAVPTTAGTYSLDVSSVSGYWRYAVAQPRPPPEAIARPPAEADGDGPDVVGPVELDGTFSVRAEHDGESEFRLVCYDEKATGVVDAAVVFEESGSFEDETTIEFEGGTTEFEATTWIGVEADGPWSFEVE